MCAVCAPQRKAMLMNQKHNCISHCNYVTHKRENSQQRKKICAIYHLNSSLWELLVIKITKGGANLEFRISDKQAWAGANLERSHYFFIICSSGNLRRISQTSKLGWSEWVNICFFDNYEENCWLCTLNSTSGADKVNIVKLLQIIKTPSTGRLPVELPT